MPAIPQGSSLSALPVAPSINPMQGVANNDPFGNMQKGIDFAGNFSRLGQLRSKIELEDAQRKADMAKSKAQLLEADLIQRDLEDKFNIEKVQRELALQQTEQNLALGGTQGKLANVALTEATDTSEFNQDMRAAARGQLASLAVPGSGAPVSAPMSAAQAPVGAVAVPFVPNAKFEEWIKPQVAAKILETRRPVMSVSALAKDLGVKQDKRSFVDKSTGAEYEVDVLTGPAGEIFNTSTPRFVKASPLQASVDKQTADDISEFNNGGREKALANIAKLDGAIKALRLPGTIAASGPLVGLIPDKVREPFTSDKTLGIQKDIRQVVQLSLKAILGSQFTEREGERMFDAAFGKSLSEEANADRVEVMKGELERLLAAKTSQVDYFRQHGTLSGFKPSNGVVAPALGSDLDSGLPSGAPSSTVSTKPDGTIDVLTAPLALPNGTVLPAGTKRRRTTRNGVSGWEIISLGN